MREVVLYNVLRAASGNHECAGGTVLREVELARADKAQHKALQSAQHSSGKKEAFFSFSVNPEEASLLFHSQNHASVSMSSSKCR